MTVAVLSAIALDRDRALQADDVGVSRIVQVIDAQGKVRTGMLTELNAGQITLGTTEPARLALRNLVLLKFPDRRMHLAGEGPFVVLADGEILALRPDSINDEAMTGRWIRDLELPAVKVPLESVRGIVFDRPVDPAALARLLDRMLDGSDSQDLLILRNGDLVEGEFAGLDKNELALKTEGDTSKIPIDGVRALVMNPQLAASEPFQGEGGLVSLTDGSRFRARNLKFVSPDHLALEPRFGGKLRIHLNALESIRFLGGCATWLSDLAPADYRFEPFFQLEWPLRRDRTVAGGFLKVRGSEYAKGLGVHSRSTISYALDGKYRRFHASIGIDDDALGKGSVIFEVLLDGKVAFTSETLTGTSPVVVLQPVDLTGAKTLSLRVDYAGEADILDHADWCDAVIVR
jgi:hypothetical protein